MVDLVGVCLSFILSHQWTCWCVWKYFNPPGHWQSGPCARARVTSMNFLPQYLSKAFKDMTWMLSYSAHECYRMVKEFPWKIIKCGRYEVMCVRARARARARVTNLISSFLSHILIFCSKLNWFWTKIARGNR